MTATTSDYSSRPCPDWCTDCSGWEGAGGIDGRTHRVHFGTSRNPEVIEIYLLERKDGSVVEAAAELFEPLGYADAADLQELALSLRAAAEFMARHHVERMTTDPVRLHQIEAGLPFM